MQSGRASSRNTSSHSLNWALEQVAIPSQIALVTEIPKTSVGKLDKKRIRLDITEWQANNSTFLSTL